MRRILAALFLLALPLSVQAQQSVLLNYRASPTVVTEVSPTNPLPVTGSFSAGGFAPASTGTPITATTGGATGTLPAGTVVVATNVGTTNGAYCALGGAANTSSQYIAPNGGWFSFTVGVATQLTCATSTSTTTVNMTGGAGLATGTGGGGGSSGNGLSVAFAGAIGANGTPGGFQDGSGNFQPLLGDVTNGQWVSVKASVPIAVTGTFWQTTQPVSGTFWQATQPVSGTFWQATQPVSGTVTANAGTNLNTSALGTSANQSTANGFLSTIATNSAAPIPGVSGSAQSSSNPMGWVNINQTTDGTTNAVNSHGSISNASSGVATGSANVGSIAYNYGFNGTTWDQLQVDGSKNLKVAAQGTTTVATAAADPCQGNAQIILPFAIATGTTTNILTGTSAKKIYVCYLYMQTGIANNVAVIEGTTGATCGTSTKALVGGTTAATGLINAANSGQAFGNGGYSVLQTTVNNNDICIITSASGPLSGVMKYVVQ